MERKKVKTADGKSIISQLVGFSRSRPSDISYGFRGGTEWVASYIIWKV